MRCTTTLRGTQEEAAGTFKALSSAGSASLLAMRLTAMLSQPSTPAPSVVERDDLLKWGDASKCITSEVGKFFTLVFSARRGRHVFTLLIIGPRLEDEVLRKVLLPRLEYLELG